MWLAYDHYLRAAHTLALYESSFNKVELLKARRGLEQALAIDPHYARLWWRWIGGGWPPSRSPAGHLAGSPAKALGEIAGMTGAQVHQPMTPQQARFCQRRPQKSSRSP